MDSLDVTGARAGMRRIIIKRLSRAGKEFFIAQNTPFNEEEIMDGCAVRKGLLRCQCQNKRRHCC
jgi:hypothetical protein